ncbi:MAG: hypothetical protein ACPL28_11735, partial [bacterium]
MEAKKFIESALIRQYYYNDLLNLAFSRFTKDRAKLRFSRWINVTDTERKKVSDSLQICLAKVKGAKTGDELPILYEALKPDTEFTFEINAQHSILNENKIIDIVDNFYRRVLNKDKANIKPEAKLIRLGQGSSAYATSCLLLA